jgi:hypothetical protein
MSCGGLPSGITICKKNMKVVEELPKINPGKVGYHWKVLYKESVFNADRKSNMATGHRLTLDPMGKCSNAFFSETTNMIKAKLYMRYLNIFP